MNVGGLRFKISGKQEDCFPQRARSYAEGSFNNPGFSTDVTHHLFKITVADTIATIPTQCRKDNSHPENGTT